MKHGAWASILGATLAMILLGLAGGCTLPGGGNVIGLAQTGVDVVAAKYGASGYVATAREALAEAEAAKVNRVLLPPGLALVYDHYLDGRLIDPARILRVPRLVGGPVLVSTNLPPPVVEVKPATNGTQATDGPAPEISPKIQPYLTD